MPAILAAFFVAADNGGHGVPAVDGADAPFHVQVAGEGLLLIGRDRILVRGRRRERQSCASGAGLLNGLVQKIMRPIGSIAGNDVFYGVLPFAGFYRINIVKWFCHVLTSSKKTRC